VLDYKGNGGEGGIRTPDTLSGMPVFKTGAINHSATSPAPTHFGHVWLVYNKGNESQGFGSRPKARE
jgi:hypothetical protein